MSVWNLYNWYSNLNVNVQLNVPEQESNQQPTDVLCDLHTKLHNRLVNKKLFMLNFHRHEVEEMATTVLHAATIIDKQKRLLLEVEANSKNFELLNAIAEFSFHTNWELSYCSDPHDDLQERCWIVHEIHGGVYDREWYELARGDTVQQAIINAVEKYRTKKGTLK